MGAPNVLFDFTLGVLVLGASVFVGWLGFDVLPALMAWTRARRTRQLRRVVRIARAEGRARRLAGGGVLPRRLAGRTPVAHGGRVWGRRPDGADARGVGSFGDCA